MKVDNAVIMAAGTSSRFAPLSYELPKALIEVKGEILIERQISQLIDAGVNRIYVVTGYKAEMFSYLVSKFGVELLHNPEYLTRNNNSSIWTAKDILANSYICSADNYFSINPFENEVSSSYYSAVYAEGSTTEWCITEDEEGYINSVAVGGRDSWVMLGQAFWSSEFSRKFLKILSAEYYLADTAGKLWETIFAEHLDVLKMRIRHYEPDAVFEFDTLDELRKFDKSYVMDTRSIFIKKAALRFGVDESQITDISAFRKNKESITVSGFNFSLKGKRFFVSYDIGIPIQISGGANNKMSELVRKVVAEDIVIINDVLSKYLLIGGVMTLAA